MGEVESAIAIPAKTNQSTDLTLLILPSSFRAVIFTCHSFSHFGRCQAAGFLAPPDEGNGEPG